ATTAGTCGRFLAVASTLDRNDLILCAGTVLETSFRQRVRIAAETGFTGIGLRISDLHQSREENLTLPDMRRILDDYGIVVAEIDSLTQWMPHHKHQPGGLDEQELLQAIDVLGVRGVNVA